MLSTYHRMILEDAPGYDPAEIECYMRLKLGTLDHLDRNAFRAEVCEAVACVEADPRLARRLVSTYGPLGLVSR
ncbi:MAG TPA: hypothetical protein VG757_04955 [Devosia sp.]|nr:hypothetical protein [Devosia sp.]